VDRTWIAVELGGERQAHAAPGTQVRKLLVAQRFHGALLQARIGHLARLLLVLPVLVLRQRHPTDRDEGRRRDDRSHVVVSPRGVVEGYPKAVPARAYWPRG
jgi:hypothetical protein